MIERVMNTIVHGVGHPLMVPASLTSLFVLYALLGVDGANFTVSIVTLLLLPVLQYASNRDGVAIQTKLDALVRGVPEADDTLIGIDKLSEKEIEKRREL
jgi:low affinity Fe/Cu permease